MATVLLTLAPVCRAEAPPLGSELAAAPEDLQLSAPDPLTDYLGRPILQTVLVVDGKTPEPLHFDWAPAGQPFSPRLARQAVRELLRDGRFASIEAQVELQGAGVLLRFVARARYVIGHILIEGDQLPAGESLEAAAITEGSEITAQEVPKVAALVWQLYSERGYPRARVSGHLVPTTGPQSVDLRLAIDAGPPEKIAALRFEVSDKHWLGALAREYGHETGERADLRELQRSAERLKTHLRENGYQDALVVNKIDSSPGGSQVLVQVQLGPLHRLRFEGNNSFDATLLNEAIAEQSKSDTGPRGVVGVLTRFYEERGFVDVRITPVELRAEGVVDVLFQIREGEPVRVVARSYPCLSGSRSESELDDELDGFLSAILPGGDELLTHPDPNLQNRQVAPQSAVGRGPTVFAPHPTEVYTSQLYEKALAHVRDLYRSEGYLSADVGPAVLLRRQCDPHSAPSECRPVGPREAPPVVCRDAVNAAQESPSAGQGFPSTCKPDPSAGISCESKVVLSIPVQLGPRTTLWDVQFRGNRLMLESELSQVAALPLGAPLSQLALQQARRRILDAYGNRGFAFANVDVDLELSQDRTRGRAVFIIGERAPVTIGGIIIRGADRTSHGLIQSRLELKRGQLYRSDLVRTSEEQLATLGTFTSVKIGLQDPDVPARQKTVVVTVRELPSQYIDVRPGISTGEGFRARFEYGHRNLTGRAVQARLRLQLGYLPNYFIFDSQVRSRFARLSFSDRLERRNTLTFEFPLAKRLRLALDGVDARDNSRDFGITKRATVGTFTYRPQRGLSLLVGSSFELNDARIFSATDNLETYLQTNPQLVRLLNVPDGRSFAIAGRLGGSWDQTDNPLGATRGYRISAEIEPVVAFLSSDNVVFVPEQCSAPDATVNCEFRSRFLKVSQSVAGYIPFNNKGLSLALSFRWGANFQLVKNSSTYPDRLFFFGGGDSLRGFLQASVIPADIDARLSPDAGAEGAPADALSPSDVVIRGGDFVLNPRIELRIPLTKTIHTAVFVDSGNVWREIDNVNPFNLRYTAGTGIRAITPIGPLAFDYGIKLDPRFYDTAPGAFHFSVGLF